MADKADISEIIDKIIVARVSLLMREPFFGNMSTRLKLEPLRDDQGCKTAATDGRRLLFYPDFFKSLTTRNIQFVVAHEVLHLAFDHLSRVEHRNRKVFNIACDYAVNGVLVRDRIGDPIPNFQMFHDPMYYGWGAEQIYDHLMSKSQEELDGLVGELLDDHIDWGSQYSKEELQKIRDEIRDAVLQSAEAARGGNIPAEIARMITDLTEPKMNWRQLLRQQIQSIIRNDYSFMRPNRKGWHMSAILPGTNFQETIDICVALDLSGSISDAQARDFLSEVKGIMEEFKEFKLKLWTFDTNVYNAVDYDSSNMDSFMEYELTGGGGTLFECNWAFMEEHNIVPKKFVMFTDMYPCGSWGDPDYCDTIFIAHGTKDIVAPFGLTAYYE